MFYTIAWRHGWVHGSTVLGRETFRAQVPGYTNTYTEHKTLRAAKLAITRNWRLWCTDPAAWRLQHGDVTFNAALTQRGAA